ncbi:hypothetical protein ACFRFH_08595 [Leifsonia sp. NPDC056824]|uniref:hypothetical protein n=1 Tax=Leifsonia sp. NPDC056824 TaxID=3345953 RepID=UPI0036A9349D
MKSALDNFLVRLVDGDHTSAAPSRPRRLACDTLFRVFGHRVCCRVPEWTSRVGQPWDTYDVAPWNLYNIIWAVETWIRQGMTP